MSFMMHRIQNYALSIGPEDYVFNLFSLFLVIFTDSSSFWYCGVTHLIIVFSVGLIFILVISLIDSLNHPYIYVVH